MPAFFWPGGGSADVTGVGEITLADVGGTFYAAGGDETKQGELARRNEGVAIGLNNDVPTAGPGPLARATPFPLPQGLPH